MKKILFSILIALCFFEVSASDFPKAEQAFKDGDYTEAITELDKAARDNPGSVAVLYDLGTVYAAQGNLGKARLYLERARKYDPRNKDINANLNYVVSKVEDANKSNMTGNRGNVEPDERGFIGNVNHAVSADFTSNYWAAFAAISFLLFLGSVALYLFPQNVGARKVGFFGGMLFLAFSCVFIVFSFMATNELRSHEYGVITAYKYHLHEQPEEKSKEGVSPLTQGTKVRIVSEEADVAGNVSWYKVRLNGNYTGWIPAGDLEVI